MDVFWTPPVGYLMLVASGTVDTRSLLPGTQRELLMDIS